MECLVLEMINPHIPTHSTHYLYTICESSLNITCLKHRHATDHTFAWNSFARDGLHHSDIAMIMIMVMLVLNVWDTWRGMYTGLGAHSSTGSGIQLVHQHRA